MPRIGVPCVLQFDIEESLADSIGQHEAEMASDKVVEHVANLINNRPRLVVKPDFHQRKGGGEHGHDVSAKSGSG